MGEECAESHSPAGDPPQGIPDAGDAPAHVVMYFQRHRVDRGEPSHRVAVIDGRIDRFPAVAFKGDGVQAPSLPVLQREGKGGEHEVVYPRIVGPVHILDERFRQFPAQGYPGAGWLTPITLMATIAAQGSGHILPVAFFIGVFTRVLIDGSHPLAVTARLFRQRPPPIQAGHILHEYPPAHRVDDQVVEGEKNPGAPIGVPMDIPGLPERAMLQVEMALPAGEYLLEFRV